MPASDGLVQIDVTAVNYYTPNHGNLACRTPHESTVGNAGSLFPIKNGEQLLAIDDEVEPGGTSSRSCSTRDEAWRLAVELRQSPEFLCSRRSDGNPQERTQRGDAAGARPQTPRYPTGALVRPAGAPTKATVGPNSTCGLDEEGEAITPFVSLNWRCLWPASIQPNLAMRMSLIVAFVEQKIVCGRY